MSQADDITQALFLRILILRNGLRNGIEDAGAMLEEEIRARAGLTDHTLKELAALGHPYRQAAGETFFGVQRNLKGEAAHGNFMGPIPGKWHAGIHKLARQAREIFSLGHDIKLVHIQSGGLQSAIYNRLEETPDVIWVKVGVDPTIAEYIKYIILGTSKMIPRDFIGMAAIAVRGRILAHVRNVVNNAAHEAGAT